MCLLCNAVSQKRIVLSRCGDSTFINKLTCTCNDSYCPIYCGIMLAITSTCLFYALTLLFPCLPCLPGTFGLFSHCRTIESARAAREREVKARYTFSERSGQRWLWIGDEAEAFLPACTLEEHPVRKYIRSFM